MSATTTEPRTVQILPPVGAKVQIMIDDSGRDGTVLHICGECGRVHVRDEAGEEHFVPAEAIFLRCGENVLEDADADDDLEDDDADDTTD